MGPTIWGPGMAFCGGKTRQFGELRQNRVGTGPCTALASPLLGDDPRSPILYSYNASLEQRGVHDEMGSRGARQAFKYATMSGNILVFSPIPLNQLHCIVFHIHHASEGKLP